MRAWGAVHPREASDSVVAFLPKEAWGSAASLSSISSRGSWVSRETPQARGSGWARISLVAFAALVARVAHLPLVPVLAHRSGCSRGALRPQGTRDPVLSGGARGTAFSRGPLLACRTHGALAATLARKPNAT